MRRKSVDLPQPEGPTKTANWPSSMLRSTPLMTLTAPNAFLTDFSAMLPMVAFSLNRLFDRAERQAADELLLREPAKDEDRRDRQRRRGGEFCPEEALRRGIRSNEGRQRSSVGGRQ